MITIFSAMRPFVGTIGEVQRSAVLSWLMIEPKCQIVVMDDEEATTRAAIGDLRVDIVDGVKRTKLGAPILDDLLSRCTDAAEGDLLAFNTADVLLPPNFARIATRCRELFPTQHFFASGGRYDLLEPLVIDFSRSDWFVDVQRAVTTIGRLHGHTALDLWLYPRTLKLDTPAMPIGRGGMDGWAVWHMRQRRVPFVDFTHDVTLVHQHHDKPAKRDPEQFRREFEECLAHFPNMASDALSLLDADWLLMDGSLRRPSGLRALHSALALFPPYRFLVGQRRRLLRPHLYSASRTE